MRRPGWLTASWWREARRAVATGYDAAVVARKQGMTTAEAWRHSQRVLDARKRHEDAGDGK